MNCQKTPSWNRHMSSVRLGHLQHFRELSLGFNELSSLPESLCNLKSLKPLGIERSWVP